MPTKKTAENSIEKLNLRQAPAARRGVTVYAETKHRPSTPTPRIDYQADAFGYSALPAGRGWLAG